jgi:hypothetical protein
MCRRIILPTWVALAVCVTFPAWARAGIDSGLVLYWPLDGAAADASGDGHTGTIKGRLRPAVDRFGYRDRALRFVGEPNVYIDLRGQRGLLPRHALTVAAWVSTDASSQPRQIVTLRDGHYYSSSCSLQMTSRCIFRFEISYPGMVPDEPVVIRADSPPLTFSLIQWFHVAGVFRPGEALELWINGQLAARQPVTIASCFTDSDGSMHVGGPDRPWWLDIDELRLYARALSPADVNELYTFAPTPVFKASNPQPADGAADVALMLMPLTWKSGVTAAVHNFYFGTTPTLGPENLVPGLTASKWWPWPPAEAGSTCYWRVDEIEADGTTIYTGDTWHFTARPEVPFDPWPADGATSVSTEMDLNWACVAGGHKVYFGTNPDVLAEGRSITSEYPFIRARFDPGMLEMGMRYYWRVEESHPPTIFGGDAEPLVGPVWSFTTAQWPVIDDFESYNSDGSYRNHVHDVWLGPVPSVICDPGPCLYPPYLERTIVQSGRQAMVFDYSNVVEPYYSEVFRAFTPAQDWTVGGADTLVVHVRGLATNDPAPLCVAVEDTAGKWAVAVHPDPQVLLSTKWVEWQIPLHNMIPVNLAKVKRVLIMVGDPRNPTPGGLGWAYLDDIRVIKATP